MAVAVIGAGPAGLIAAERLAASGLAVAVFDRMRLPGRKFLLAGRGGLNLTHSEPVGAFLARYGTEAARMGPALAGFGPEALIAWSRGLGQEVFVGSSGRVFPAAFRAAPLLRAWLARLEALGVAFRMGHRWTGWDAAGALRFETAAGEATVQAEATVLALGGASWPRTGSDGGWVGILEAEGAAVAPLGASNCGVVCAWSQVFRDRFEGAALKRIAARVDGVEARGEAVVTREGLEGGVIYALSRRLRAALASRGEAALELDLRPDLDEATVRQRMGGAGLSRANALRRAGLSPAASGLVREVGGEPKRAVVRVVGLAPMARAISSAGGVRWEGVGADFGLLARPGVYVAGEMLDWDAPTGGYLLQGCFSTGWAAAGGAAGFARRSGG